MIRIKMQCAYCGGEIHPSQIYIFGVDDKGSRYHRPCYRRMKREFIEKMRIQIIREVNDHQQFIASWKRFSYRARCMTEKKRRRRTRLLK